MLKKLLVKYREVLLYGIVGVVTTVINLGTYYFLNSCFHVNYLIADIIAWIFSVIFAFVANKIWVFQSKSWTSSNVVREVRQFLLTRIGTGIFDVVFIFILVDIMYLNANFAKILDLFLTTVMNYFFGKLIVFKR